MAGKNLDKQYIKIMGRISQNILRLREARNLTQEDMTTFGFERRWYQRLESGKHSISLPTLYRLSEVFKVDISEFLKKN